MASVTLNSNVASLNAQRRLSESTSALSKSFEKLSSGLRINRSSDDAAGLSVSELLKSDARVLNQGIRNLNDGIGVLSIADGALVELSNITVRLRELATQSANGTVSNKQRRALDQEAQALSKEYNRIARTTSFNGVNLFDGTESDTTLQAGYSQLAFNFGGATGDGTFGPSQTFTTGAAPSQVAVADFNGDGVADVVTADYGVGGAGSTISVLLGNGDGTFQSRQAFTTGTGPTGIAVADFNGDGFADVVTTDYANGFGSTASVLLGNGDGTFQARQIFTTGGGPDQVSVADFNGDGFADLATADTGVGGTGTTVSVLLGNGDGTFRTRQAFATGPGVNGVAVADFNSDGRLDLVTTDFDNSSGTTMSVLLGNGDGTFQARQAFATGTGCLGVDVGDFNGDGATDVVTADYGVGGTGSTLSVLLGNDDGTFQTRQTYTTGTGPSRLAVADFNGDGISDLAATDFGNEVGTTVSVLLGNGDGTFRDRQAFTTGAAPSGVAVGDFDGDGVYDLAAAVTSVGLSVMIGTSLHGVSALQLFSLATRDGARAAMTYFAQAQTRLTAQRGQLGAFQSRAEYAIDSLSTISRELTGAQSQITDADIAEVSSNLSKNQMLQRVGSAILAQANQGPALALSLLNEA